jgi:GT2 family glycosyltransferase
MHDGNLPMKLRLGIVIIGRNEGDRLERCIRSVVGHGAVRAVVYADSGSRDGSVDRARALGADVVNVTPPFTAAGGRNAGFARLTESQPDVDVVQFLDGDTEVVAGWLDHALATLAQRDDVAAVCGRRRERFPEASVYNTLCDIEWNTPVGETTVFGGDVMIRAADVKAAGGYDASLIAGEDPDLAVRIRKAGRKILRLDHDMTFHDAALTTFSQWWTRALRGGHAFAEGASRHGDEGFWQKEVRSNWAWGAALPAVGIGMLVPTLGMSGVLTTAAYGALFARVLRHAKRRGLDDREARLYAAFCTIAKVPQAAGQAKYWWGRARRKRAEIIEYK